MEGRLEDVILLNLGTEEGATSWEIRCLWKLEKAREQFSAEPPEEPALPTP